MTTKGEIVRILKEPGISGWTAREISSEITQYHCGVAGRLSEMEAKGQVIFNCKRACTITDRIVKSYILNGRWRK